MNTEVLVRPIAGSDYDQWRPLWDGYNAFYGRSGATALPEEVTRTTWARFFDASEPVHALVAELDGRIVGIAHYLFHRSMIAIEPTCYMQDLFTAAETRGRGIGRKLIEAVCRRFATRVLAHAPNQRDRDAALRCGRGEIRVPGLSHQSVTEQIPGSALRAVPE